MTNVLSNHNPAHPALRLTPSNSPFARNPSPRSPTRRNTDDAGLQLRKVIGTTTSSANAFDAHSTARCFAYTAGAAAVVATVDEDFAVKQRFFRARPVQHSTSREGTGGYTGSPSPLEPRHRALGNVRQSTLGSSLSNSVNGREWSESPNGRSATAKDRVKAATSVALSPNGKWLAVGETGYKPRVLIFSLAEGSSDTPVAAVCEHMYGVHCLRFSQDSKYLASLGTVNDGFLYVWSVNDRNGTLDLYASNKITTLVNCITWVGRSLITVGLRFVKVWRPEESGSDCKPGDSTPTSLTPRLKVDSLRASDFGKSIFSPRHKTLQGKNSLLEELLDCNFSTVLVVSDDQAVLCAETGEICVLEDVSRTQQIRLAGYVGFSISAARLSEDCRHLHVYGASGQRRVLVVDRLERELAGSAPSKTRRQTVMPVKQDSTSADAVVATSTLYDSIVVELSLGRAVTLKRMSTSADTDDTTSRLPAHMDPILGVKSISTPAIPSARFMSHSGQGVILFWDELGALVHNIMLSVSVSSDYPNEVRAVVPSCCGNYLLLGEKLGVLILVDIMTGAIVSRLRAHAAEILDIATAMVANTEIIATAGRDRVVQLFLKTDKKLDLLQTLDEHAGAVGGVLIDAVGQRLISHSSDRTVVIREALIDDDNAKCPIAFSIERTIVLKSSPTAMALSASDQLFVAAVDRCIARYSLSDGQCAQTFKCTDNDGGEAVVVSQLVHLPALGGTSCIAAACSADKSVRLYTEYGALIARDWGHTEGITDIAVFTASESSRLVTVAADSTMYLWDTSSAREARPAWSDDRDDNQALQLDPPMRRVMSSTDFARYSRKKSNTDDSKSSSPTSTTTSLRPLSPQRLRKKTSRTSIAQPPRLEPTSRRKSTYQRSPSPPSPRAQHRKGESMRRRSMATLRTKSSDTVLRDAPPLPAPSRDSGFGSLSSASESLCRALRTYRKKLASTPDSAVQMNGLRELDKELKATSRAIAERSADQEQDTDEASMNRLLEQASERLVQLLEGRFKDHVDVGGSRQGSDGFSRLASSAIIAAKGDLSSASMSASGDLRSASIAEEDGDSIAGAIGAVSLDDRPKV